MRQNLVDATARHHVTAGEQRHQPVGHRSWPPSPEHDKACEAISLRRHCPDQVLGVAIRLSPDDLSAFPADYHRGFDRPVVSAVWLPRSSRRYYYYAQQRRRFLMPDVPIMRVFGPTLSGASRPRHRSEPDSGR